MPARWNMVRRDMDKAACDTFILDESVMVASGEKCVEIQLA